MYFQQILIICDHIVHIKLKYLTNEITDLINYFKSFLLTCNIHFYTEMYFKIILNINLNQSIWSMNKTLIV